jgi:large subunit ribosomal protein L35
MKTNSGAKKRFVLTGTGKVKRRHAYHSHILTKKTTKQKRNLNKVVIADACDQKRIKELITAQLVINCLTECLAE